MMRAPLMLIMRETQNSCLKKKEKKKKDDKHSIFSDVHSVINHATHVYKNKHVNK